MDRWTLNTVPLNGLGSGSTPPSFLGALVPATVTIRGGTGVVISSGYTLVDTHLDAPLTSAVTHLTSSVAGSGSVRYDVEGAHLDSGLTAASSAFLQTTDTYLYYDISVDFHVRAPLTPTTPVDVAVLETIIGATSVGVRARRVGTSTVAFSYRNAAASGSVVLTSSSFRLRLVRCANYGFAFVGDQMIMATHELDGSTAAAVRFGINNLAYTGRVWSVASDYTIGSNAIIDGQLLEDRADLGPRRIAGVIPATTIDRVGLRDVIIFGLFGSATLTNAIEYVLPDAKTLNAQTQFRLYADPQLRDGD